MCHNNRKILRPAGHPDNHLDHTLLPSKPSEILGEAAKTGLSTGPAKMGVALHSDTYFHNPLLLEVGGPLFCRIPEVP